MEQTVQHTQLQRVSRWIAKMQFDDIPPEVVDLAQVQVLDTISAICAGSRSTAGIKLYNALKENEHTAGGNSTVLPWGEKWSLDQAVYYHAAMINALELDCFTFMGHISQSCIAASLSISEGLKKGGRDFLLAMIVAQEVAGRLSAYLTTGPQQGHMRAFIHRIAAATAAAKLLNLTESQIANALAISLSLPEFPLYPASFSPDSKVICTSAPTVEGIRAAKMAKAGMDGPLDILEHPVGFISYFSYLDYIPDVWAHIGESWVIHALSFKQYATCGYAQGPVNAALSLKNKGIDPENIRLIEVFGPIVTVVMEKFSTPHFGAGFTPVNTHFSTRRSVAATLLFGAPDGSFYAEGNFESKVPQIEKLYNKTVLKHDWKMTIDLVRGVDFGIKGAGKPGVLSLGGAGQAMKRFKAAFGSRALLQLQDIPELLRISYADRQYFLSRYWRSVRWFKTRSSDHSYEGDLKAMMFRLGGKVRAHLNDGTMVEAQCTIPPGFAGDPSREQVVSEKYYRETIPVWGLDKAQAVAHIIRQLPKFSVQDWMLMCAKPAVNQGA